MSDRRRDADRDEADRLAEELLKDMPRMKPPSQERRAEFDYAMPDLIAAVRAGQIKSLHEAGKREKPAGIIATLAGEIRKWAENLTSLPVPAARMASRGVRSRGRGPVQKSTEEIEDKVKVGHFERTAHGVTAIVVLWRSPDQFGVDVTATDEEGGDLEHWRVSIRNDEGAAIAEPDIHGVFDTKPATYAISSGGSYTVDVWTPEGSILVPLEIEDPGKT